MPGQPGSERRTMTGQALVRMPPVLAARVRELAQVDGMTDSAWLRDLAATAAGLPDEARPTHLAAAPPDLAALALLGRQVSRLNGAVVQLTRATREVGDPTSMHAELEAVLSDLRGCRDDLAKATGTLRPRHRPRR
jgi:hypothetical protein